MGSKDQAKNAANDIIDNWHSAAIDGINEAMIDMVIHDLDASTAISGLNAVLMPLAIVEPYFATTIYSAAKAGFLAGVAAGKGAFKEKGFPKKADIRDKAKTRVDMVRSELRNVMSNKIDAEYDRTPDIFDPKVIIRQIFKYHFVNWKVDRGELDITRVRRHFKTKVQAALLGGVRTFKMEHLEDDFQRSLFDTINKTVIKEYGELHPTHTIMSCDLQTIGRGGGLYESTPIDFVENWHVNGGKYAPHRIVKINAGSDETDVLWHPDLQNKFAIFGFNYTPV